ncbi:iron-containing alcohol dehydrogenase [Pseudomonadota bacterium]
MATAYPHADWSQEQKAKRFAEAMRELSDTMGVPKTLCQWGVSKDNVEQVAELMVPLQGAFNQNPIEFIAETDALAMLRKHVA